MYKKYLLVYTIQEIQSGKFNHFKQIHNLYKPANLCNNCKNIYFAIDVFRNKNKNVVNDKDIIEFFNL